MPLKPSIIAAMLFASLAGNALGAATDLPALPPEDGAVTIPTQAWPGAPGAREIVVHVRYPEGQLDTVNPQTGLMLSLHNWGGTGFRGAPDPDALVDAFDLVVIGVDYLHSGPYDAETGPPYDFGLYQAIDALQALAWVWHRLEALERPFDQTRIYATGGSGGGNVSLMANKLAPRTFAAIVDLSGMARLSDDIAYGEKGGSRLNAGYRREGEAARILSDSAQCMRDPGYVPHVEKMAELGNSALVLSVHGTEDRSCLFPEKQAVIANMHHAGLQARLHAVYPSGSTAPAWPDFVVPHQAGEAPFSNAEHSLGNRTAILLAVAGDVLDADAPEAALRQGPSDFALQDSKVRYPCPGGVYVVNYQTGFPRLSFEVTAE